MAGRAVLIDRYRGALLGLAAGDALGTAAEFSRPGTFKPLTDIVGGGPFGLQRGQWTDDTSMALCLAESLLERNSFDPVDQLQRYVRWFRHGDHSSTGKCFDIGNTVSDALRRFERTDEPWCGSTDPNTAGNGFLMRLAPVPLRYAHDAAKAVLLAGESSRTTHAAREAIDACRYFATLIVGALRGQGKSELLGADFVLNGVNWREQPLAPAIARIASGSFREKKEQEIRASGYVVHTLEAALSAFFNSDNFRDGALMAVNLNEDADTTGAVYGQLAGAYYGEDAIPQAWRDKLARREEITALASKLYDLA